MAEMNDDIRNIARNIDSGWSTSYLSAEQAEDALLRKAKSQEVGSVRLTAMILDESLQDFAIGECSIGVLRESAEKCLDAVDDLLMLITAYRTWPVLECVSYSDHEAIMLHPISYVIAAIDATDEVRHMLNETAGDDNKLYQKMSSLAQVVADAYRNAIILEMQSNSSFTLQTSDRSVSIGEAVGTFNRTLVEIAVSSGAIAIRPAALGANKQQSDVFPKKKKNRWYLKYVVNK